MPIEMPRGLPFSVDTWSPISKCKRHHFLTHAHKDHSSGILTYASYPIYCSHFTKSLVLLHFPKLEESSFVCIEVGESKVIEDPDGEFKVTAFDANHCPGAVMFLFEGNFGNILHTGDCRLSPEYVKCLPQRYISMKGEKPLCQLDYVFLDCTFGKSPHKFPSKHLALQQVTNCIWKHPKAAVVYLTCDLLGQEDVLTNVSRVFGSQIYIDKFTNPECYEALLCTVPEVLTEDPSSRFQVLDGFPKLYERAATMIAKAQVNFQPEPLIIRPSAQWYACEEEQFENTRPRRLRLNEAARDQFGVWHVCYSIHSSREELEWALELLTPKWVVSTTPSCRAMELDYVKKHCLGKRLTVGDPLWKLMDISVEATSEADPSTTGLNYTPAIEEPSQLSAEVQLSPAKESSSQHFCLSPRRKRKGLTLFGRARLFNPDPPIPLKGRVVSRKSEAPDNIDHSIPCKMNADTSSDTLKNDPLIDAIAQQHKMAMKEETCKVSCSSIGSSKSFSETLRNFYRSRNVPIPRPLPSLVQLMDPNKRPKR